MKTLGLPIWIFLFSLSRPALLPAQEVPPANLAEVETARSRSCVATLAQLAELDATLEPYGVRIERLNVLGRAVSLEKREDAEPFDPADPMEAAVAQWFTADTVLARSFLQEGDSTLLEQRRQARTAIFDRLVQAIDELSAEAQMEAQKGAEVESSAPKCVGAILVRSAVAEVCDTTSSPVCEAALAEEGSAAYRFVDEPQDLWSVERFGPWTQPEPLRLAPDGSLAGARTNAEARRGNVLFTVSVAPLIRRRSELTEEEVAEFDANLDSLGFTFGHPLLVMAPAFEILANLPAPIGGEDLYIVHFGDLSRDLSGDDVIWRMDAGDGGVVRAFFPAKGTDLARLQAGEPVSLTAVRSAEEEGGTGEAVFTLSLLQVGQSTNVPTLLQYMAGGAFDKDLMVLVPPGGGR